MTEPLWTCLFWGVCYIAIVQQHRINTIDSFVYTSRLRCEEMPESNGRVRQHPGGQKLCFVCFMKISRARNSENRLSFLE